MTSPQDHPAWRPLAAGRSARTPAQAAIRPPEAAVAAAPDGGSRRLLDARTRTPPTAATEGTQRHGTPQSQAAGRSFWASNARGHIMDRSTSSMLLAPSRVRLRSDPAHHRHRRRLLRWRFVVPRIVSLHSPRRSRARPGSRRSPSCSRTSGWPDARPRSARCARSTGPRARSAGSTAAAVHVGRADLGRAGAHHRSH